MQSNAYQYKKFLIVPTCKYLYHHLYPQTILIFQCSSIPLSHHEPWINKHWTIPNAGDSGHNISPQLKHHSCYVGLFVNAPVKEASLIIFKNLLFYIIFIIYNI